LAHVELGGNNSSHYVPYLPLKTVLELRLPGNKVTLELFITSASPGEVVERGRKGEFNLAVCPGWQAITVDEVVLKRDPDYKGPLRLQDSTQQLLAGKRVKHIIIRDGLHLDRSDVEVLASEVGTGVEILTLFTCTLNPGVWLTLSQQFPGLREMRLWGVDVTPVNLASYLRMHCTSSARPFKPTIHDGVLKEPSASRFKAYCNAWPVTGLQLCIESGVPPGFGSGVDSDDTSDDDSEDTSDDDFV
jgi:hypothetical protein